MNSSFTIFHTERLKAVFSYGYFIVSFGLQEKIAIELCDSFVFLITQPIRLDWCEGSGSETHLRACCSRNRSLKNY